MSATNEASPTLETRDPVAHDGAGLKQRIRNRAHELVEDGQVAAANLGAKVRGQVRDRPLTALVVAGGIGLLLGLLVSRKR